MLKKLKIHNFKSLVDFEIDLQPFTVLIGPNASGKSTILQAIDFIKWFGEGNPGGFLEERGWETTDIRSKLTGTQNQIFSLQIHLKKEVLLWDFKLGFKRHGAPVCLTENLSICGHANPGSPYFPVIPVFKRGRKGIQRAITAEYKQFWDTLRLQLVQLGNLSKEPRDGITDNVNDLENGCSITYQEIPPVEISGSVLSLFRLDSKEDWHNFYYQGIVRQYLGKFCTLELLSPEHLKKKSRLKRADIGITGKYLAAFLDGLKPDQRDVLDKRLKSLYKRSRGIQTIRKRAGWTEFFLREPFYDDKLRKLLKKKIPAQHISDGILRIIAILAALEGLENGSTILIDEIENGIYPDLAHIFIKAVQEIGEKKKFQIIATTHSPAIINAWPDESIIFVWRDEKGHVKAEPLFEDPEMKERLDFMSPGAVWHNTPSKQIIETLEIQHARKKEKGKN